MKLAHLAVIYVLLGVVLAVWRLRRAGPGAVWDASLLVLFWPLLAPVSFRDVTGGSPATRCASQPLHEWLPDPELGARLEGRVAWARRRIGELDAVLATDAFDLAEAHAASLRLQDLEPRDPAREAVAASRVHHIERLARARADLARELTRIDELLTQLRVQAAVVHLTGEDRRGDADLADALLARVECLDEMVAMTALS